MGIIDRYKRKKAERRSSEVSDRALTLYQVCEHGGELWLTYNDSLVCPCRMLGPEPVEALNEIRELYIKRNSL